MANIKYLTLEGLTHFKDKLDNTFAAHLTGQRTNENVNIILHNNVPTGDTYAVLDSISIPAVTSTLAGVMTPNQLNKLNSLPTVAFSKVVVGSTTIEADSKSDTLTVAADTGISISGNKDTDTITIGHADTSTATTSPVGPTQTQTQTAETDLSFTVPQITVDGFGHVTALTGRTITVKDTNTKTTETGHYTPTGTTGEVTKSAGTNVTTFGNTITFVQSVTVDSKKHLTGTKFGSLKLTETTLSKGTSGSGNGVSDISVTGHKITLTKASFATPDDVASALASAKEYANTLELSKFDFKGDLPSTDTSAGPATHNIGDIYRIPTAGTYLGATYEVGDFILCINDGTTATASHWASLNTNWQVVVPSETPTISASETTIATIGGVNVKAKIKSYSLSTHTHANYVNQNAYGKLSNGTTTTTANATQDTLTITGGNNISVSLSNDTFTISATNVATSGHKHDETYKKIQTAVSDPTAEGNSVAFIDSISQNAQGAITATKKTIRSASTSTSGIVKLVTGDLNGATSTTDAAAAKHTHSQYSSAGHNHDETYSKLNHTHTTADITDTVITKINSGVGISATAEGRTPTVNLKSAATTEIGGIKVWDKASSYTVTATKAAISANVNGGKYYAVQTDKNDKAFVYVPWQNDNTTYGATNPITLTNGKFGLSYVTETVVSGSMTSSTYVTYNKLGLSSNKLTTVIENITNADIDALF